MLVNLAKVFQYDGDIHVDNDEETDDEISDQVSNCHAARPAVAVRSRLAWRAVASYHIKTSTVNVFNTTIGLGNQTKLELHHNAENKTVFNVRV